MAGPLNWSLDLTVVKDKEPPLGKAERIMFALESSQINVIFFDRFTFDLMPLGMTGPDDKSSLYCDVVSFLPGLISVVIPLRVALSH